MKAEQQTSQDSEYQKLQLKAVQAQIMNACQTLNLSLDEIDIVKKLFKQYHFNKIKAVDRKKQGSQLEFARLKEQLQKNPLYYQILGYIAKELYSRFDKRQEAFFYSKKSLQFNPNYAHSINIIGLVYLDSNKLEVALEFFQQGLKIEPKNIGIICNLAITFNMLGRGQEAFKYFKKANEISPNDSRTLNNLGYCYAFVDSINLQKKDQPRQYLAIEIFIKAIQVDPMHSLPFYNLGFILKKANILPSSAQLHPSEFVKYREDCILYIEQLQQKAKQNSFIYFNMSLFFSSIDLPSYKLYFSKFIQQFIRQQQKQEAAKDLKEIFDKYLQVYGIIYKKQDKIHENQIKIQKIVFCDTLELKEQFIKTLDTLLSEYQLNEKRQIKFNQNIIDQIIQKESAFYPEHTKREYIPYILKYLMIKFKHDTKYRYILFNKYHALAQGHINTDILQSTVFAIQIETMLTMLKHFNKYEQKIKAKYYQVCSQSVKQNLYLYQCFHKLDPKNQELTELMPTQSMVQQIYRKMSEDSVENESLSQQTNSLQQIDRVYQLLKIEQQIRELEKQFGEDTNSLLESKIQIFNKIYQRFQCEQMNKQKDQTSIAKNIEQLQRFDMQSDTSLKIKLITGQIYKKLKEEQALICTKPQLSFYRQFAKQKQTLSKQFIEIHLKAQQQQQNCFARLQKLFKSLICRDQIIYIHNNFLYFFNSQSTQNKLYSILDQIFERYTMSEPFNFKERLNDLLNTQKTEQIKGLQSEKKTITSVNSKVESQAEKFQQSKRQNIKRVARRKSFDVNQNNEKQKKQERLKELKRKLRKLDERMGLILPFHTKHQEEQRIDDIYEKQSAKSHHKCSAIQDSSNNVPGKFQIAEDMLSFDQEQLMDIEINFENLSEQCVYLSMSDKNNIQSNSHYVQSKEGESKNLQPKSNHLNCDLQKGLFKQHQLVEKKSLKSNQASQRHRMKQNSSLNEQNRFSAASPYEQSFDEQKVKVCLLGVENHQIQMQQRPRLMKNYAFMIRYLSNRRSKCSYIAKYKFHQSTLRKKEQSNQYSYFKISLTKGRSEFVPPEQSQKYTWYVKKLWSKGVKQVLYWIYCVVSGIKQLQLMGILHPDIQFRNTILVDCPRSERRKDKYCLIDFDYSFKVQRREDEYYYCLYSYTKSMIEAFILRDNQLYQQEGRSIFVNYMFREVETHDNMKFRRVINLIHQQQLEIEKKVELVLKQLQTYMFFYHRKQLQERLQELLKIEMDIQDQKKIDSIKQVLISYKPIGEDASYQQMLQDCHLHLYDIMLQEIQKIIE